MATITVELVRPFIACIRVILVVWRAPRKQVFVRKLDLVGCLSKTGSEANPQKIPFDMTRYGTRLEHLRVFSLFLDLT